VHDHEQCKALFDLLSSYLDSEMEGASCGELERHMSECEPCRRYVDSLRATRDALVLLGGQSSLTEEESESLLKECMAVFARKTAAKPGGKAEE
jgi:predicted anti-sigma-YlaC factor YlaD